MTTRVLLTVDTELVWRHHAAGHDWRENFARSYEAAGVGIPYQLAKLREHDLKACFFVDPMPAAVHGLDPVRRMVEPILAAGQEVQLHLHPFWAHLEKAERNRRTDELTAYDLGVQRELIAQARELLVAAGVPDPIAFRSGSYAANEDTARALADLGFRYDSSHNGSHHPAPSALPLPPGTIAPVEIGPGLIELPVSQIGGAGGLRHLQICAVSFAEMRAALLAADKARQPVVTVVSHSFELATRNGLAVNRVVRRRFDRLCAFLGQQRESLPTATFATLPALPLDQPALPPTGSQQRRLRRMAGQAWGNLRYERFAARAAEQGQKHVG
jgi:peptidoglycan/xylan/chitin deacetylase (PgdA/CDA1 family)